MKLGAAGQTDVANIAAVIDVFNAINQWTTLNRDSPPISSGCSFLIKKSLRRLHFKHIGQPRNSVFWVKAMIGDIDVGVQKILFVRESFGDRFVIIVA